MAKKHWYLEPNGDELWKTWDTHCDGCGCYIHESYEYYEHGDEILCGECAFKQGKITEREYIKHFCYFLVDARAAVHNGEVYVAIGKEKFPWEKTCRQRSSQRYTEWRKSVFERDNYTCVICGQHGGELNAHHVKPYADFPDERLNVDNGVTLCRICHRRVHKEKDSEWLYLRE